MRTYILYITLITLVVSSCDLKEDYVVEKSKVVEAAGEWWVKYTDDSNHASDYIMLKTYNTAADDGKAFWITDDGGFWDYKVKCPITLPALTFSGTALNNVSYESVLDVNAGKVILKGGKSTSGVVVDSIYFEVVFHDGGASGTTPVHYKVSGHRRTGFLEDEH